MGQGCRHFKQCRNLPSGHCVAGCRLFLRCQNITAGHCVAGVQAVKAMWKPVCLSLCCRGEGCLSGVGTYLPGLVFQDAVCLSHVGTDLAGTAG